MMFQGPKAQVNRLKINEVAQKQKKRKKNEREKHEQKSKGKLSE